VLWLKSGRELKSPSGDRFAGDIFANVRGLVAQVNCVPTYPTSPKPRGKGGGRKGR